jgi:hypothetical protein
VGFSATIRKMRCRTSLDSFFLPARRFTLGDQTPVQAEAGAMPADHGLGSDHHESLLPSGPELAGERPEEFVERAELGPGMPALQYRELLSKRQIFKQKVLT